MTTEVANGERTKVKFSILHLKYNKKRKGGKKGDARCAHFSPILSLGGMKGVGNGSTLLNNVNFMAGKRKEEGGSHHRCFQWSTEREKGL